MPQAQTSSSLGQIKLPSKLKYIVLDILKPHRPNILKFAEELAYLHKTYSVNLKVIAVDEKTESVEIMIEGEELDYEKIEATISKLGGSVHSIDEVSVGPKIIYSKKLR
ncbi:DUF211 domain-containing protein [Candidatus Woesearchaeota archaeon]|nr:DUF211 domain-containing protein [Candidatus Woesearchaeota archaeon]